MLHDDSPGPSSRRGSSSSRAPAAAARSSSPSSSSTASLTAPPPLPPRPDDSASEASPRMVRDDSPHPAFTDPSLPRRANNEEEYLFPFRGCLRDRSRSPPSASAASHGAPPPRRRLTSGNIPTTSVAYSRNPEKVVAYLIPLPVPTWQGQDMNVPQVRSLALLIWSPHPPGHKSLVNDRLTSFFSF